MEEAEIKLKAPEFVKQNWYAVICVIVFAFLFYVYMGNLFDHSLEHNYPFPYFAADQFSQHATVEGALNLGHYRFLEPYLNWGNEKTLPHYSPGMVHLASLATLLTGTKTFNAIVLIYGILFLLIGFVFLEALRIPKQAKLISLSFFPLLIVFNFVIAHMWGQYGSITGTFFLFLFFICMNIKEFRKPLFIGLTLTFIAMGHFPELVFAIIYFILFILHEFITNKDYSRIASNGKEVFNRYKTYIYGVLIFLIVCSYYLFIFYYGDFTNTGKITKEGFQFSSISPSEFGGFRVPTFSSFGYLGALIVIGTFIILLFKDNSKLILLFMIFATNLNYFSFFPEAAFRAFQQRFYWPITLAPLFAIAIYFIIEKIKPLKKNTVLIAAVIFIAVFAFNMSQYRTISGPEIITQDQYDAMTFMEKNTDDSEKIVFLYGDGYDQSTINFKKLANRVPSSYMIAALQNKKINANDKFESMPHSSAYMGAVFKDGKIVSIPLEQPKNYTICDFDYYILDTKTNYNTQIIYFNQLFMNSIVKDNFKIFYQNGQVLILKNKGGEKCLTS